MDAWNIKKLDPPVPVSAEKKIGLLEVEGIKQLGVVTGAWRVYEGRAQVGIEWTGHRVGEGGVRRSQTVRSVSILASFISLLLARVPDFGSFHPLCLFSSLPSNMLEGLSTRRSTPRRSQNSATQSADNFIRIIRPTSNLLPSTTDQTTNAGSRSRPSLDLRCSFRLPRSSLLPKHPTTSTAGDPRSTIRASKFRQMDPTAAVKSTEGGGGIDASCFFRFRSICSFSLRLLSFLTLYDFSICLSVCSLSVGLSVFSISSFS